MISVSSDGDFRNTDKFLQAAVKGDFFSTLHGFGQEGVSALARSTPQESGYTASSWSYEVIRNSRETSIIWSNNNVVSGVPIAIILQYGHGTGTGGYVQGRDYINPALRPIFDRIANAVWKEVTNA